MTYPSQKITMHEAIFFVMHEGKWFTTWDLQEEVIRKFNVMWQETSLSAGLRDFRKIKYQEKFGIDLGTDPLEKRKRKNGKGYEYKLNLGSNVDEF